MKFKITPRQLSKAFDKDSDMVDLKIDGKFVAVYNAEVAPWGNETSVSFITYIDGCKRDLEKILDSDKILWARPFIPFHQR